MFSVILSFFLVLPIVTPATEKAVREECLPLDGVDGNQAVMHQGSCYVIPFTTPEKPMEYQNFMENLARCNHMPNVVDGHLIWTVYRSQMNSLAAAFTSQGKYSPFEHYPHLGMYRYVNTSISPGKGWYFIGYTMNDVFGPLPDLLADNRGIDVFDAGQPDNVGDDLEVVKINVDLVVMSRNGLYHLDDQNIGYKVYGRSPCQYDSIPMNKQFGRSLTCKRLDEDQDAVQVDAEAKSHIVCVRRCLDRGEFCTAVSFDKETGCRYALLIGEHNLGDVCDTSASEGRVYLRID